MSDKKEGWYIFVHREGDKEFEVAHFIQGDPPGHAAICGQPTPFDLSGMEPWNPHDPGHIAEIRQCRKCQAAIAVRDGREPMKEPHAATEDHQGRAPQLRARAGAKRPASKAARQSR